MENNIENQGCLNCKHKDKDYTENPCWVCSHQTTANEENNWEPMQTKED
jgi:hypothetical protein